MCGASFAILLQTGVFLVYLVSLSVALVAWFCAGNRLRRQLPQSEFSGGHLSWLSPRCVACNTRVLVTASGSTSTRQLLRRSPYQVKHEHQPDAGASQQHPTYLPTWFFLLCCPHPVLALKSLAGNIRDAKPEGET